LEVAQLPLAPGDFSLLSSITAAVDRFQKSDIGQLFEASPFSAVQWEVQARELYEDLEYAERYRVTNGNKISIAGENTIVVNNVATLNNNYFFHGNAGTIFSVRDEEMRREALRKGYKEVRVSHYMSCDDIPAKEQRAPVSPEGRSVNALLTEVGDHNYPNFQKRDGKLTPLFSQKGETYAQALLRAWEDRIIYEDLAHTPYVHWDMEKAKAEHGLTDPITRLAKAYVAVKLRVRDGDLPENIKEGGAVLQAHATKWRSENKELSKVGWFNLAIDIYNKNI
jgi:hypothetical protein